MGINIKKDWKMISEPQKIIDKFYEDEGRRLLKKKKTMRKLKSKIYTNFEYNTSKGGEK